MDGAKENVEHRRQALTRILATLFAMAGLDRRATLSRNLRNAVLRLLRPAELATRRLAIALAQSLSVAPPGLRMAKLKPLRGKRHFAPKMPVIPGVAKRPSRACLPLFDRRRHVSLVARRRAPENRLGVPHIGFGPRDKIMPRPTPSDPIDATRLKLRLDALSATLADLPGQALRIARWQARQHSLGTSRAGDAAKAFARRPLRGGRPPGWRKRPKHEVDEVLAFAHDMALDALARRDSS